MAQDVSAAWTAEEKDSVRRIAHNLLVSWKKEDILGAATFTIGVSTIGGNDYIGINPGAIGSPGNYRYFDESDYVISMGWERSLNMPLGGLSMAMGEAVLDNTSGRYLPEYMGGSSELYTAILPRRPVIFSAGFEFDGIDQTIPQFTGVLKKMPYIDKRRGTAQLQAADYVDFFSNRYLDQEVMFTAQRTDQVYETLLQSMGLSTSQYDLDVGINNIPFGLFEKGTRYSKIFAELAEAENGHFYQDEMGIFKFANRQHWDASPFNEIQRVVLTGQVINAEQPAEDHIINVVEVVAKTRQKQPRQVLFKLAAPIQVLANEDKELFIDFEDPVLAVDTVNIKSNVTENSPTNSSVVSIKSQSLFAKSLKIVFTSSVTAFVNQIDVFGRPARITKNIYTRLQDDSSVTAYQERPLKIENDYIQYDSWANSYAQMVLNDFSEPENIQKLTIRAMPSLQTGDLISWQGRYWRIFTIKTRLSPATGFVQDLTLLQRNIEQYFIIGVSTIGSVDKIAP